MLQVPLVDLKSQYQSIKKPIDKAIQDVIDSTHFIHAAILAKEFDPVFHEQDLTNIEAQNIYVKTVVNGTPVRPFSMNVARDLKLERAQGSPEVSRMVKELSRLKYGRDVEEVEREIEVRAKL